MKLIRGLIILFTVSLAVGSAMMLLSFAKVPSATSLNTWSPDTRTIVVELTLGDHHIETTQHDGVVYHRVIIPDTEQTSTPGAPRVPAYGTLVGLPTTDGVSVHILEAVYTTYQGYYLQPGPELAIDQDPQVASRTGPVLLCCQPDRDLYARDAFYPGRIVEIDYTGQLRDQPVAQLRFYPVQYNAVAGETRIYRRIRVQISWDPSLSETAWARPGASPIFEDILSRVIVNYPDLERPSVATTSPATDYASTQEPRAANASISLKIGLTDAGMYRLTYDDLTDAGLDLSTVNPRALKMTHRGAEIPIIVQGQDDDVFDPGDYVLFYANAITDLYTTQDVFWLTAGGENGQRIATRDVTPSEGPVPVHFPANAHVERDTQYWQSMPDGAGQDHWFWGDRITAPAARTFSVTLDHISTSAVTATVRVRLKGRTDVPAVSPDHHTRLFLNGTLIDDQLWDGQAIYDHEIAVSHGLLNEGQNELTVESVGDTGAVVDQMYINWFEIDYKDSFVAEEDELLFGVPTGGTYRFEVSNFGGSARVYDVTEPEAIVALTGPISVADGSAFRLTFQDDAQSDTRYLALMPTRYKAPASITVDQPSAWRSPANGADYIVITHQDFYTSALRLAEYRGAVSGLRVETVQVRDIYDEFNYGVFHPAAIRDFLTYAYHNWSPPAPTFVLLVGDATHDYRDNLRTGTVNYVPSQIIETDVLGQTSSDNWFVRVSGDDILPDMLIGRLSVQEVYQLDAVVDKIIDYEQQPPDATWNQKVLLVADDDEPSFEMISEQIASLLPLGFTAHKVYASRYPPGDPTADIAQHIGDGSVFVSYAGHGHIDRWGLWNGSDQIFDVTDIAGLDNTDRLPVVTIANCLNGFFTGAHTEVSSAEAFQRLEDRGAVAVWASTGLGYPSGHRALMEALYTILFEQDEHILGAVTTEAKIAAYNESSSWGELVQTFVLFGDPAQFLGFPARYPFVASVVPAPGSRDVPIDQDIVVQFNKPMDPSTVVLNDHMLTSLPYTSTWNADHTLVSYAHPPFSRGETLTYTVSGSDIEGKPLGRGPVTHTWSFVVTDDNVPPDAVIGLEGGALVDVGLDAAVIITFTEAVRPASVVFAITPEVFGQMDWKPDMNIARFNHARFDPNTTYLFSILMATDLGGNPLEGPVELSFRTEDLYLVQLPIVIRSE